MAGQKICRTCAKKENATTLLTFLFSKEADELDLRGKIKKYTPIELHENDNLPKSICGECKNIIINWHEFWEQSLRIDNDLKLRLINSAENMCITPEGVGDLPLRIQSKEKSKLNISSIKSINKDPQCTKTLKGMYCIAKWCNNNNTTSRMFRLPKDKRCLTWLTRAGREDLKGLDIKRLHNKYLCGDHFTENMFNNSNKNLLRWNALPSIFLHRNRDSSFSPYKASSDNLEENSTKKHYRPVIFNKSTLDTHSTPGQPQALISLNSLVNLKQGSQVSNVINVKHCLTLNADERIEYLACGKSEKSDCALKLDQEANDISLQHNISGTICSNSSSSEKNNETKEASIKKSIIKAVKVIDCNKPILNNKYSKNDKTIMNEEINGLDKQLVSKDGTDNDLNQNDSSIFSSVDDFNELISGCSKLNEESQSYFSIMEPEAVTPINKVQNVISKTKSFNSYCSVVPDLIENFKDSDVDSLCSGQGFKESMYPCFACGEVFLAKSSLAQHCKTYHGEIIDDIS